MLSHTKIIQHNIWIAPLPFSSKHFSTLSHLAHDPKRQTKALKHYKWCNLWLMTLFKRPWTLCVEHIVTVRCSLQNVFASVVWYVVLYVWIGVDLIRKDGFTCHSFLLPMEVNNQKKSNGQRCPIFHFRMLKACDVLYYENLFCFQGIRHTCHLLKWCYTIVLTSFWRSSKIKVSLDIFFFLFVPVLVPDS